MKKFGFIAAAVTMVMSIASVHAAEEGINIYYDAADARNNETTRCVDVVVGGDVAAVFQAGEIWFDVDESAYVSYEFVPVAGVAADPIKNTFGFFYESEEASIALTDGKLGYLKFTVEADAPAFTVTLNEDSYVEGKKCEAEVGEYTTVTIPAWSTTPVEPELPVFDDELAATPIDALFDEHTDTVPVKAWMTDAIDWSSYKEVKDLKWVITVGGVDNEVKATQAELSGDMTVIYALAIAGRADQLETIESVVLK